jgi:hypothetical protein
MLNHVNTLNLVLLDTALKLEAIYATGKAKRKAFPDLDEFINYSEEHSAPDAQNRVGWIYEQGLLDEKDFTKAAKWYGLAAGRGFEPAQQNLAKLYFYGFGVPKNYVEAYKWADLAAAKNADAVPFREFLEANMSRGEIAEGQQLASEFAPTTNQNNSVTADARISGTGFFITEDGYLISNYHVVKDAAKIHLFTRAGLIDATVVQVDEHGNVVGVVSAKLGVEIGKALTSDELPENVNYAVKSSFLLSFLESVPDVSAKLKAPNTADEKFSDVVKSAQDAAVLVLVY